MEIPSDLGSSGSSESPEYGKFFNIGPTTLMCIQENGMTCIVEYEDLYPQVLIRRYDNEDIRAPGNLQCTDHEEP
jgi:hypothetical protein